MLYLSDNPPSTIVLFSTDMRFEFVAKNGWTKSANDGHPNETGHHKWAKGLHKFIVENQLCMR